MLFLGDLNAHSPTWNPHCQRKKNAKPLKHLIEKFDLLINNESGRAARPASEDVFIISAEMVHIKGLFWTKRLLEK